MKAMAMLAGCVMAVGACQRDSGNPDCDPAITGITDSSIGPVHLGEAVGALRVRCRALLDTMVIVPMAGLTDTLPAKRLIIAGVVPVLAIHDGRHVTALRVTSPGLRTQDSIEVGSSVARFRDKAGVQVSYLRDSRVVLLQDRARCGTTFELSRWGGPTPPDEDHPPAVGPALAAWTDAILVTAITVARCLDPSTHAVSDSVFNARDDSLGMQDSVIRDTAVLDSVRPTQPKRQPDPAERDTAPRVPSESGSAREIEELKRQLVIPVQGVTRSQLRDTYAEARGNRTHEALDIPARRGTPVISAMDGKLMRLFNSKTGGLMVYAADPTDRFVLLYGHLDRYANGMSDGMSLKRGQVIGYVGTTGNAPIGTPHLHFGILRGRPSQSWSRGTAINPFPLLTAR
jgi:murein DD-endopeptidase MepM/ murein hydrolase activator NlpD